MLVGVPVTFFSVPPVGLAQSQHTREKHESIAMAVPQAVPLVLGSSGDDDLNELVERLQTLNPETKAQVIALVRMA